MNSLNNSCNGCKHRGVYMCTSPHECTLNSLYVPRDAEKLNDWAKTHHTFKSNEKKELPKISTKSILNKVNGNCLGCKYKGAYMCLTTHECKHNSLYVVGKR